MVRRCLSEAQRRLIAALAVVVVLAGAAVVITNAADAASYPAGLTVRGSIEQLYVLNAPAAATVSITGGPGNVNLSPTANASGAHLQRNLVPGQYTVRVNGGAAQSVTVRDRAFRPAPSWYTDAARKLTVGTDGKPTDGFLETADGTLLDYRVDLPTSAPVNGKYDVVVLYSGYRAGLRPSEVWEDGRPVPGHPNPDVANRGLGMGPRLLEQGYAVVGVNMRGSGCSGGAFDVMEPLTGFDGYDVVETLNAQPWVDDVALSGGSWLGLSQLFVAQTQPPNLDAMTPGAVVADFYRDTVYPGGIYNTGYPHSWAIGRDATNKHPSSYRNGTDTADPWSQQALPIPSDPICTKNQALRSYNVNTTDAWRAHPTFDSYWQDRAVDPAKLKVPMLVVDSWQDYAVGSRPATIIDKVANPSTARLLGTNGEHGAMALPAVWAEVVKFLDVYLDDVTPVESIATYQARPRIDLFLEADNNGSPRGRLGFSQFAAPTAGQRTFNLGADLVPEIGGSSSSSFTYDPKDTSIWSSIPSGFNPQLQDHASFVSAPLTQRLVMAGSGSARVRARGDGPNGFDLQITLLEVRPDGQELGIQSGWQRVKPTAPGTWTDATIELFPFAHVFRPGSRLKLVIDGPDGAVLEGFWNFDAIRGPFDVSIAHGAGDPASLTLPVRTDGTLSIPADRPACGTINSEYCRPSPSITTFTGSATGENVTLNWTSSAAFWDVAAVTGPKLRDDGGTSDVGLVLNSSRSTTFKAPPGRHRYTLSFANAERVPVSRTIEVDVKGFDGADTVTLAAPPTTPYTVSWNTVAPRWSTFWLDIDGNGLSGQTGTTTKNVAIPANRLGRGTHTVTLVSCNPSGCSNHHKVTSPVAGKVISVTSPRALSGVRDSTSLVATIQPTGGGAPIKLYAPKGVLFTAIAQDTVVTANQQIGLVLLDSSSQEQQRIVVQ